MDIAPAEPVDPAPDNAWRLDRHVPIALIGALLLQTAWLGWWASGVAFRLDDHERRVSSLERTEVIQTQQFTSIAERLARIDERLTILVQERPRPREQP